MNGVGGTVAGCIIRKATLKDIPDIYRIELMCFSDPWDYKGMIEMMGVFLTSFYVAEAERRIIGFSAGAIEETDKEKYGHVCNLAVVPELRRLGIGRLLLRTLERDFFLGGCSACSLEVRISNKTAHKFYEKIGYEDVIVFEGYYGDGEDAIVMMRWF
ncbi:MAG TPA: ribosomal protein S18-alanine N-acetyltransferase [Methanocorpusculum sp.]|nr:ribosomal protein S18-alanine N-acetyltransferase [Methanocorpusculum sp.]HJK01219.1 ribosomal protein S18-alanine N-acetyltransferase [Methanocorpusculum sp.]HJK01994.1 ribosomal protein S18-alanine N-acetyltransferase [Methanocorpusculum sp.]